MAAEEMARAGFAVTIYERMPSPARKLLMAGRGGLNLTHSEPLAAFMMRYGAAASTLTPMIEAFTPEALRGWSELLGEPTFTGSSGRVFPKSFKASPLLRIWLRRLDAAGVVLKTRHSFTGFDAEGLPILVDGTGTRVAERAQVHVFALGGGSWPRLGADGSWLALFRARGIEVRDLVPANCGFELAWSEHFVSRFAGKPLKPLRLSFGAQAVRGEAMVTREGLEGGAIYALSAPLREAIAAHGEALLLADLHPDLDRATLALRLGRPRNGQSMSSFLRKAAGLSPQAVALLREACGVMPVEAEALAGLIKQVPLRLLAPRPLDRAISSAGGVALSGVDAGLMLKQAPGLFVCGEMLDWEAPTGGYLLQASFATGHVAGCAAARWAML